MTDINRKDLYEWCKIPYWELEDHPLAKVRFRLCQGSDGMGQIMARELVDEILAHNQCGEPTRAIIPCGPTCWYKPFTDLVNREQVSLKNLVVFHMDECLDWQGRELPRGHPFSFRGTMEKLFYEPVDAELAVPEANRNWLAPDDIAEIEAQDLVSAHRHHLRRLGARRTRRLQPGATASLQPGDGGRAAQFHHPYPG